MLMYDLDVSAVPAENLVGLFVMIGFIPGWRLYRAPYRIQEVREDYVMASPLRSRVDETAKRVFYDKTHDEVEPLRFNEIQLVTDSIDKVNAVVRLCRDVYEEKQALKKLLSDKLDLLAEEGNLGTIQVSRRAFS